MRFPTLSSPHLTGPNSTTRVMAEVLLALVPGIVALVWYFGWGVVINVLLFTTLITEIVGPLMTRATLTAAGEIRKGA